MLSPRDINQVNLGRIVPPPNGGSDVSPTFFPPRLFIVRAGAAGLAANAADKAGNVALTRSNQSNTSSPNPVSNTGSAGSAGLDGTAVANTLRILNPIRSISGPAGAPVSPTVTRMPKWVKPALFVLAGVGIGAVIFRG